MRFSWLAAAIATSVLPLVSARPALASCAPPASLAEYARRADAVVHGRVTAITGRALQVSVVQTLKGNVPTNISVYVGPGRGSVITSVDYTFDRGAQVGTEHVLFIMKVADGYETNACVGSHPGAPTSDEGAFFGAATTPAPTAPPSASVEPRSRGDPAPALEPILVALTAAAVLAAAGGGFLFIRHLRRI